MTRQLAILLGLLFFLAGTSITAQAIGEEDQAPLAGECVLYLSNWDGNVLVVDTGEVIPVVEGVLGFHSTYDASQIQLVGPLNPSEPAAGFVIVTAAGASLPVVGMYLGSQINQDGDVLFGVDPDEPTPASIYIWRNGDESIELLGYGTLPTWGPDGWMAFSQPGSGLNIFPPTGDGIFIAPDGFNASWSPNGQYLAYNTLEGEIGIFDLIQMEPISLEWDGAYHAYHPVWVDNETLLLSATGEEDDNLSLYLMNPFADSELTLLLSEEEKDLFDAIPVSCLSDSSPQPTDEA